MLESPNWVYTGTHGERQAGIFGSCYIHTGADTSCLSTVENC